MNARLKYFYCLLHKQKETRAHRPGCAMALAQIGEVDEIVGPVRPKWSVERIAAEIHCHRSRVNDTLNNKPGRGAQIRPKLVRFFKAHFPDTDGPTWRDLLEALGWNEDGTVKAVPRGTLHVAQSDER